jgi:pilus assembly protein CpaF
MKSGRDPVGKAAALEKTRRRYTRNRTFWNGRISTAHGHFRCRVLDMSVSGGRLRFSAPVSRLPLLVAARERVRLVVDRLGEFPGVLVWQRNNEAGIEFVAARDGRAASAQEGPAAVCKAETAHCPPEGAPAPAGEAPRLVPQAPELVAPDAATLAESARIDAAVAVIRPEILAQIRPEIAVQMPRAEFERQIAQLIAETAQRCKVALSGGEQAEVRRRIIADLVGFGPLERLLADETVSDILVNGPHRVYVERKGKLELTDVSFADNDHVLNVASRIVTRAGRRIDESAPFVDARLPDGSRVNVIIPPLALRGPMVSIRKFVRRDMTLDDMARAESLSPAMAIVLKVAARARLNILVAGGTGAGKTTMLNALSQMIDPAERIITIEDAAELQLQLPHVGSLETRPPNVESRGEVTARDLFRNALRMRPDRIIVGEVRGAEAFDMLQAMNSGHDGSLGTIHASGPREALTRLENIVVMSGIDLPVRFIRSQIAAAIHLLVQVKRMQDGMRRVTSISEVVGMEGEIVTIQELFAFHADGVGARGEVMGRFIGSGLRPHFMPRAEAHGLGRALTLGASTPDAVKNAQISGL